MGGIAFYHHIPVGSPIVTPTWVDGYNGDLTNSIGKSEKHPPGLG